MEFEEALIAQGFRRNDERLLGAMQSRQYVATPNRFMTYSVYTYDDGTAIFSWEFAIADYLADKGIQVGSDEALNQFLYPREDARGPQDAAWLGAAIENVGQTLASVRFDDPDGG